MNNAAGDPLIGRTVAQYEVVARLGGGGMGVVYAARDTKLGRRVALKFLPPQWSHDEAARERFIREAQAASSTDHRNICTIHDIGSGDEGQLFIVMAHYDGETLKERLDKGPLPVDEAVEIATQVAEGLAKAHAQGVVHRDIKPGNLMLTEDGVKILDFGLAKLAETRFKLTLEGSTIGTIAYMSPEQARGEDADVRSDVWAIGVVLYEMLAGTAPFKGGYPEAIAHAIKHDPPPPLRGLADAGTVGEALEQIVFRALHKTPAVRFQSARDLARALRQLQGRTLPLDLRTEPVPAPGVHAHPMPAPRRRWRRRNAVAVTVAGALALVGAPLWMFSPLERTAITVAPVANLTGEEELDSYRLALTHTLIADLSESRDLRPLSYARLAESMRGFVLDGRDVSSREAIQLLAGAGEGRLVVIPALLFDNGRWHARAEIRDGATGTSAGDVVETAPVESALPKETAHALMASLAGELRARFRSNQSRARDLLAAIAGTRPVSGSPLASLDAAEAFERGLRAFGSMEFAAARDAFSTAAARDRVNPLPVAWLARVNGMLGRRPDAVDASARALGLISGSTPRDVELYVRAVDAESRGQTAEAEGHVRELAEMFSDDPAWAIELAAFHDRQGQTEAAVETYHAALRLNDRQVRPHLELCRLYNSTRMNEASLAKMHGEVALTRYRATGDPVGEAHALLCRADTLRVGRDTERAEAGESVELARGLFERAGARYNLPRAFHYAALVAGRARIRDAIRYWELALPAAEAAGNTLLEATVLINLGVAYDEIADRGRAIEYFRRSAQVNEARGDQRGAAYNRANAAELTIRYGSDPAGGLRDVQGALAVLRKLGDRNFEALCLQVIGVANRNAGRYDDAERELRIAMMLAREIGAQERVAMIALELGRVRMERGDAAGAAGEYREVLEQGPATRRLETRIELGRALAALGDLRGAQAEFAAASTEITERDDPRLGPSLHGALGILAYQAGRHPEARSEFARAAAYWTDDLPDPASVEAAAYLGLLEAIGGNAGRGKATVERALKQATAMGRVRLEALARQHLARIAAPAGATR